MQTGNAGFSLFFVCLVFISMEGKEAASQVRRSDSLCAGEQDYVARRKLVVLKALKNLQVNCTEDAVPHIALLASGGGQRAAVGLVGSAYQLQQDGLLDTLLYLGGVSGSTWSMSSLYYDPEWSSNMDGAVARLSGPGVELEEALGWLDKSSQQEDFSLSDIWGVLTSAGIMKQMNLQHLSEEAKRNATNPYPVYSAVEKRCYQNGPTEGKWFEVTPHEAGFTEMGLFIQTSLLGSKFQNGTLVEERPEMDMVRLQGLLGCALADEKFLKSLMPAYLNVPGLVDSAAEEYVRVYSMLDKLVDLTRSTIQDPTALADLDHLQKILKDMMNHNQSALLEAKSPEERKGLFQQWSLELVAAVENWSQNLEDGAFKTHASVLTKQVIPLIIKWEWGTTRNFLYQYQDSMVPPCLHTNESLHLIDAGLLINVAYPAFLGEKRDIDLIIAPEYSAGNIFETLTLARDYAAEVKKPFPEIDNKVIEDRDWPKDCYVFEGKGKEPTIVYMPLFNRRNCKDVEELKAKREEFSTFQRPFSPEKINFVLETAKANMKNNRETLLREIHKATVRRRGHQNHNQKKLYCHAL
ncbi:cytosolic phospholipase A2 gamma-like isoform X2 [Betta splendens]|uniref:Cytosolic phospholipase A2 gamma-like isoform X2 n=1 Tax=Betta splendens TaxID=158456 RepID=A0A6P7NCR9_BETSP|nr:cytosolic phospholipase A2 gamma-like isoform X2 [Betta splendens]